MQLKRIQLAGFKSFVDPITIPIRGNLNAIVGPNGCGKSNIVDAIRWVTGEMSAKQLRGQSMADVIFNGTTTRKPVGKAAVELIFDNSDHRITGEYAGFTEIAIRREVERDGQSAYFINGVPARRRDLVDLFLGTGLGPRSYAIIEQGMIAQLVEAKPEDLRAHFEEVAGISKYRERRRETENRIRHTQENLERLNDVRDELDKQLRHLQRQSKTAEQYKVMQEDLRILQAQLKALQWQRLDAERQEKTQMMNAFLTEREAYIATQQECETNIERLRVESQESQDEKNLIQKKFYELGSEIGRLEQQIQHKQEQLKAWHLELAQSGSLFDELDTQSQVQSQQISSLTEEITTLQPKYNVLQEASIAAHTLLQAAEIHMRETQIACDDSQARMMNIHQQGEIVKNNIAHYESQKNALQERVRQIDLQLSHTRQHDLSSEINPLAEKTQALQEAIADNRTLLSQLSDTITKHRNAYQQAREAASQQQGELQKLEAQHASISALQKVTLEDRRADIHAWLAKQGLLEKPQLGKMLQVEAGWEQAVEVLLQDHLDAICLETWPALTQDELPRDRISLLSKNHHQADSKRLPHRTVSDIIQHSVYAPGWLSHVYLADNVNEALSRQSQLASHESIVTRDGCWIGPHWLRMATSQNAESGFLFRERQLKELQDEMQAAREQLQLLQAKQAETKQALEECEITRDTQHRIFQENTSALTESQTQLTEKRSRLTALDDQQNTLSTEYQKIQAQSTQCQTSIQTAQQQLSELMRQKEEASQKKEQTVEVKQQAEAALIQVRQDAQSKKQQADEWQIVLHANEKQLSVLTQSHHANQRQLVQLRERRLMLTSQTHEAEQPLKEWAQLLQTVLAERASVEGTLRAVETRFYECQDQLREQESKRDLVVQSLEMMQEQQQTLRMMQQEVQIRQTTIQEQLVESQFELTQVIAALPSEAEISAWEVKSRTVQEKIDRLGPINLAAIEECQTVGERKTYLDQQMTDLQEALEILQNAIRKIDRETKHLFKDTFDQVNQHFQALFPRVFRGGQSELVLTDEDLLTAGILVKAQPPGKRNTTIHMLSGGEKTLTAIALMFAMFQINPAPFCVLDEVDAPLDDLNVGRYCQLIKEMSKDTQFLVISHNKLTIESAEHLMGVTMQEPGVSRIVSVDIQEAVSMVEEV